MTKLLTVAQVADILDLPEAQVYALGRADILPVIRLGRSVRVAEDQLEQWIRRGGQSWPGGWRRDTP